MFEHYEYMDTIMTELRDEGYNFFPGTDEPDEEDWPDDLWDEVGFDPYEGCYTGDC